MQFLYWVEGQRGILTPKDMAGLGLGYAFERSVSVAEMSGGPTQTHGLLVSADGVRMAYLPDQQTWRRIPAKHLGGRDGKVIYVGMWNDLKPTPAELCRSEQIPGEDVDIQGQSWHVPIARSFDGTPTRLLPSVLDMDDEGNWVCGEVEPRYRKLWDFACEWFDKRLVGEGTVSRIWSFDAAVQCLTTNYRMGHIETLLLRLLDDQAIASHKILDVLVDAKTTLDFIKKNQIPDGSNS